MGSDLLAGELVGRRCDDRIDPTGFIRGNQAGGQDLPPCSCVSFAFCQPAIFFDGYAGRSQVSAKHMLRHLSCPNRYDYRSTGTSLCHFDVRSLLAVPLPTVRFKKFQ